MSVHDHSSFSVASQNFRAASNDPIRIELTFLGLQNVYLINFCNLCQNADRDGTLDCPAQKVVNVVYNSALELVICLRGSTDPM